MPFSESGRGFDPTSVKPKADATPDLTASFAVDGKKRRIVPESEMKIEFSRSGGPGGQGVNTADSKAILHWHVGQSNVFTPDEKCRIREKLKLSASDMVVLHCSELRTQGKNKALCIERLHDKLHLAIQVDAERKETTKPAGVRRREVDKKKKEGEKKRGRARVDWRE